MGKTPTDSIRSVLKETGITNRVDNPSDSISECLIGDVSLPEELITDILVRLPVKSLLRFKCVSKPWLSLISDPQFVRSHFSNSSSMDEVENSYVGLLYGSKIGMKKCSLYSALHEPHPSRHLSGIEFPVQNMHSIVGIINGLVCLKLKGNDLCVWNPALNKIKHCSNVYPQALSDHRHVQYCFSFGYDESNDDYKVVCLQPVLAILGFDSEVSIYSLKADSWRTIDRLKGFYLSNPGVFAYGNIYWLPDLFAPPKFKNVSLDMSSDKFVELQPPKYDAGICLLRMGVSGGRPFVFCDYYQGMKLDLWVLDKYGVEESWCKLVSMPYNVVNHNKLGFIYRVLCISWNGGIVFGGTDGLIVYNWKKKESRNIELVVDITTHMKMAAYVESLVWPNYV